MKAVSRETATESGLKPLLSRLLSSNPIKPFSESLFSSRPSTLSGLPTDVLSLLLCALSVRYSPHMFLVSLESSRLARTVYDSLCGLLDGGVFFLPNIENNPSDVPGFKVSSEQHFSEFYREALKKTPGLYLFSSGSLERTVLDKTKALEESFLIQSGKEISRESLVKALSRWGYDLVDSVVVPKCFSVRGGIVDIFLLYANTPVRLEFFGNLVESVRLFEPSTQRSIRPLKNISIEPPPGYIPKKIGVPINSLFTNNTLPIFLYKKDGGFIVSGVKNPKHFFQTDFQTFNISKHSNDLKTSILNQLFKEHCSAKFFYLSTNGLVSPLMSNRFEIVRASLPCGFTSKELDLVCLSSSSIHGVRAPARNRWDVSQKTIKHKRIVGLHSLEWGDFLIHIDYGIGVYRGLEKVGPETAKTENIKIEYAGGDFVFVPIDRFNRVHKYVGAGDTSPKLSKLGSSLWEKQKSETRRSVKIVADELISLYKTRKVERGFAYTKTVEFLGDLESSFPFVETKDQAEAIKSVLEDLDKPTPMDRLIYGDVGFGKTEVAIRAALKAVESGRTVFFLAPTTILADQHYITCKQRLEPLGVRVDLLSRFRSKKDQASVLEKTALGQIDLIVGTHRLLSGDLPVSMLGLLIVDEEHRFGVKHKIALKHLKKKADVLTLTATPIPRTLQQSLLGIRDLSRIETPPKERHPIITRVKYFDWAIVEEKILIETGRGGQVYFLHNDIESMPFFLERLCLSFPSVSIAMAHGKMPSRNLEKTMLSFFEGSIDVLICTTIIESGLDVANANTILINNAHRLGLSQTYQIRGRVGRSNKQAYCYLLIPRGKTLSKDAFNRLKAIEHYSSLGAGYDIALKDLEIRGAGNLFGYEQSGHISRVGYALYNKILKEAIDEASNNEIAAPVTGPVVSFSGNAFIPDTYVPLVQDRLSFYQRLSEVVNRDEIKAIESELCDRFGPLPKETKNLIHIAETKKVFSSLPVSKIFMSKKETRIIFKDLPLAIDAPVFINQIKEWFDSKAVVFKVKDISGGRLSVEFSSTSFEKSQRLCFQFAELFSPQEKG